MDLEECKLFAMKKHGNQKRKQGTPYYTHPLAVCELLKRKGFPEEYQVAGLFHDLLEDTDTTYDEIVQMSNTDVAEAVRLVTKEEGYNMANYIARIKQNDMARMVKLADRIHNLTETHQMPEKFQRRYIKDTEDWFPDLAKGTVFEDDLNAVLEGLKKKLDLEYSEH